jgi:hypothetical protein
MKVFFLLGVCILSLVQLSCGDKAKQLLTVETRFKNIVLIDGPGRSCTRQNDSSTSVNPNEPDLSPVKGLIGGLIISWNGTTELEILYIRIRLNVAGGNEQIITISGIELGHLLTSNGAARVLVPPGPVTIDSSNFCNFEIGGINIGDKTKSQFGQGTVLVYGTTIENGQQKSVQAQSFFSFQFDGIN